MITRETLERWRTEANNGRSTPGMVLGLLAAIGAADALAGYAGELIYAAERAALHNAANNPEWFEALAKDAQIRLDAYQALVETPK